ncbi:MAG: IS701 family transposase [Terriglobales bacterium]
MLRWDEELVAFKSRLAGAFGRSEVRSSAGAFIDGLLSGISRKTGWQLSEQAGLAAPYRLQSLLGRSSWDANVLRDLVRGEVLESLGDDAGVLVVDETGFLKKGVHSVGVARQYSGTAGRVENCQVGVFLGYASRFGQALIDRRLYLPQAWAADGERRHKAAVPQSLAFATKPQIAAEMIAAALDAGIRPAFVLADALYGACSSIRHMLETRRQPYVLATRSNHTLRFLEDGQLIQTDPLTLADALPSPAWATHPAGEGSKGIRLYEWARLALPWNAADGFERWLLFRRNRRDPKDLAYYLVFTRSGTSVAELAGAAGLRWTIEECFQRAKEELGLDHCEARSWHGWHRHMTLCMAAGTFLARLQAQLRRAANGKPNKTSPTLAA